MTGRNAGWIATADGSGVSPADCLRFLQRQVRLPTLALQVLADRVVSQAARQAGLDVGDEDLQQAADRFRKRHGLSSAELTHRWLGEQGWSVADFEASLEHDLLLD